MGNLERIIGSMLGLIFVYIVVQNARGSSSILDGLTKFGTGTIKALQGR